MSDKELLPHNCPKLFNDFAMCPTCDFQQTRPSPELSEKVHSCNQGVIDSLQRLLATERDAFGKRETELMAELAALQSRVDALEGAANRFTCGCPPQHSRPCLCIRNAKAVMREAMK
jgi:hypothetical protein